MMDSEFEFEYCKNCQTRIIDKSENPNSVLCRQCREELIHYPIPKWIYVLAAVIVVLVAVSFVFLPESLKIYRTVEGAEKRADEGYIFSTLSDLNTIAEQNPSSNQAALKLVDVAMEHGYYDYAAYALDTYLVGEEVSDSEYYRLEAYTDVLDRYYNTYDAYDVMLSESSAADENAAQKVVLQLQELLENPDYDPATVYYYMGYSSLDDKVRCEYFEKCYQIDSTYTDAAAQAGNSYRRAGDLSKARELVTSAYEEDKESPSVLRSLAVIEMLDGNTDFALSLAEEAYQLNQDEYYVADTYLIALSVNGQSDRARELKASMETEGYEFDEELEMFIDGELTLKEYYME